MRGLVINQLCPARTAQEGKEDRGGSKSCFVYRLNAWSIIASFLFPYRVFASLVYVEKKQKAVEK